MHTRAPVSEAAGDESGSIESFLLCRKEVNVRDRSDHLVLHSAVPLFLHYKVPATVGETGRAWTRSEQKA